MTLDISEWGVLQVVHELPFLDLVSSAVPARRRRKLPDHRMKVSREAVTHVARAHSR